MEEGKYREECDARRYKCDRCGGWNNKPDEVDAGLTAQLHTVKKIK